MDDIWHVKYGFDMPKAIASDQLVTLANGLLEVSDGEIEMEFTSSEIVVNLAVKGGPNVAILAGLHHIINTARSLNVPLLNSHLSDVQARKTITDEQEETDQRQQETSQGTAQAG